MASRDRDPSATVQFPLRMKERLRGELEARARERRTSLNAELIRRLERTLIQDRQVEDRYRSVRVKAIVDLVADAFLFGGEHGAHVRGHPEWTVDQWLDDPAAKDGAFQAAVDVLLSLKGSTSHGGWKASLEPVDVEGDWDPS